MTTLYTAKASAKNGREGHVKTSEGIIDLDLTTPGGNKPGANPELLFASGYAACFGSAVAAVAKMKKLEVADVTVESEVSLHKDDSGFSISAKLNVLVPSLDDAAAADLVKTAHTVCPYSKATQGNIDVSLSANGKAVESSQKRAA
jgi:Ohr subfamily peroxiredoxin